jgi:hypothetical protein
MTSPLEKLVWTAARALGEEESAVRSRWQLLRKAGLWSRTGRGRTMGYPTAADVGNLLLSFMAGERTTTTGRAVPVIRDARLNSVGAGAPDQPLPPIPLFEGIDRKQRFGHVLDRMLRQWSKLGGLEGETPGTFVSRVVLTVDEGPIGFQVELLLQGSDGEPWDGVSYLAAPGIDDVRSLKRRQEIYRERFAEGPDLSTRRAVSDRTLSAFARCLSSDAPVAPVADLALLGVVGQQVGRRRRR